MIPSNERVRWSAFTLGVWLVAGCAAEGSVEIRFLLPDDDLSPMTGLSEITVITDVPGEPVRRETLLVPADATELTGGTVPIADGVEISVELRAATRRLIGYGRSDGPVDVALDGVTEVPIRVRRPFAYVTGATSVQTFDTAREAIDDYAGSIAMSPAPTVMASTHGGGELLTAASAGSGGELRALSTASHAAVDGLGAIPLSLPPAGLAITPDDRFAVIGHAGAGGGISIVELADLGSETGAARFVALGDVTRVVGGLDGDAPIAYALVGGAPRTNCAAPPPPSQIVLVDVASGDELARVEPGAPIADIAVDRDSNLLVMANTCANQVVASLPLDDPGAFADLHYARAVSQVAVQGGRVWAVGATPQVTGMPAYLSVSSARLDGSDEVRVALPAMEERAQVEDLMEPGQSAEIRIGADDVVALDMAVVPGGNHVAVLSEGFYHGTEMILNDPFFGPIRIIPEMTITTYEYLLVDIATGGFVQRVRTWCDLKVLSDTFLQDFRCTRAAGQDAAGSAFRPQHINVLYGSR